MNKFSQLFNDLDESTKTNDRLDHLVKYLIESAPEDSIWVCWFLAGNRIKGAIKTSELRTFASERSGLQLGCLRNVMIGWEIWQRLFPCSFRLRVKEK